MKRLTLIKCTVTVVVNLVFFLSFGKYSLSDTTGQALGNNDVGRVLAIKCPDNSIVNLVTLNEQDNYGIIDIKFGCSGGQSTGWATGNRNGNRTYSASGGRFLSGFIVHEQYNYGVIDLQLISGQDTGGQIANNYNADRKVPIVCPGSQSIYGAIIYEQDGYGVIDIALLCR